jgi:hypothetical protein
VPLQNIRLVPSLFSIRNRKVSRILMDHFLFYCYPTMSLFAVNVGNFSEELYEDESMLRIQVMDLRGFSSKHCLKW